MTVFAYFVKTVRITFGVEVPVSDLSPPLVFFIGRTIPTGVDYETLRSGSSHLIDKLLGGIYIHIVLGPHSRAYETLA